MTKDERIAALEARIAQLEARLAQVERDRWVQTTTPIQPQPVYVPSPTVYPAVPLWPQIWCSASGAADPNILPMNGGQQ